MISKLNKKATKYPRSNYDFSDAPDYTWAVDGQSYLLGYHDRNWQPRRRRRIRASMDEFFRNMFEPVRVRE